MKALRRSHTSSADSSASSSSSSSSSIVSSSPPSSSSWGPLRSLLVVASYQPVSDRGSLKSPWSRRKRKCALSRQQWNDLFTPEGKFRDGGVKFLKKVRSGGIEPGIRAEVWPFLLAVYDLNSSEAERNDVRVQKRKEFKKLRRRCNQLLKPTISQKTLKEAGYGSSEENFNFNDGPETGSSEDVRARHSLIFDDANDLNQPLLGISNLSDSVILEEEERSDITNVDASIIDSSSDTLSSSGESESEQLPSTLEENEENGSESEVFASLRQDPPNTQRTAEDFVTWQRIIRLDAIRASAEWVVYSPMQATVSLDKARLYAEEVGLKDYDHLEPCRIYHAARLVAILESYAIYDEEIGYCQGMSDLLSPILAVVKDDCIAFWCFVGFMRKARHNFRLDEVGIRRQLNIVSKIIKSKDSHLYRHLEKLQAEDCFFVYRMVVVLFRRELTFEQTVCLWEVMWADQAAIRARIEKSAWGRMRVKAPPTDDLLLYAIAASVLQKRKLIIEKYSSMDEIVKECNSMAGQLDVWKLLDDAHDLVVTLQDKVS